MSNCKICGHSEKTDEHAGISHIPFSKAHSFVPGICDSQHGSEPHTKCGVVPNPTCNCTKPGDYKAEAVQK